MEKRLAKKVLVMMVALVLAVVPVLGLAGCGADPAKQVADMVNKDLGEVKNLDSDAIDDIVDDSTMQELEGYGVSAQELVKAFYGHFDYRVDSVQVEGDTATAQVWSSNVDLDSVMEDYMSAVTEYATTSEAQQLYLSGGQDALEKKLVEMLMEQLQASDVKTTEGTTEVTLQRSGDDWEYSNEGEVMEVLFGGQDISALANAF